MEIQRFEPYILGYFASVVFAKPKEVVKRLSSTFYSLSGLRGQKIESGPTKCGVSLKHCCLGCELRNTNDQKVNQF